MGAAPLSPTAAHHAANPARFLFCDAPQAGLWHQLLGSAPVAAHGGAISEDRGASLNLAVEAARIAAEARQAPTIGKRPANVGFALAIGQLLHAAATGERLGAGSEAPAGASRGSAGSPGGSPGSAAEGGGGAAASDPLEGANPLKEKPLPPGFKLPRIPSASSIPLAASGTAVSDLPAEDEGWERQLTAQLATEGALAVGLVLGSWALGSRDGWGRARRGQGSQQGGAGGRQAGRAHLL